MNLKFLWPTLAMAFNSPAAYLYSQSFDGCTDLTKALYSSDQIIKPGGNNPSVNYARPGASISDVSYAGDLLGPDGCNTTNNCEDGADGLFYEVYYPDIHYSDNNKLPAVILFHGGGFSDCSSFDNADGIDLYCKEFAKRGFIAFNVEYRRGRILDPDNKYTSASEMLGMYRAFQDGRGAVRTIVDRELKQVTPYRIDLNNIFVGGCSAGGYIALDIGYYTPHMINQICKSIKESLGPVDGNNYAGNAADDTYTIRGVLNMWGGANVPVQYKDNPEDFFAQNPKRPALIAFHGNMDGEVNIYTSNVFFSPSSSSYSKESSCVDQPYSEPDNGSDPDILKYGSQKLYELFTSKLNIQSELYVDCDMGHGLDEDHSDFGLKHGDASAVTDDQVQKYIVERTSTFFQYVMNRNFPYQLKNTKFVDCENERSGCNPDSNRQCAANSSCPAAIDGHSTASDVVPQNHFAVITQENKVVYVRISQPGTTTLTLYSAGGAKINTWRTTDNTILLDGTSLSPGIYIIRLLQGNNLEVHKIVLP